MAHNSKRNFDDTQEKSMENLTLLPVFTTLQSERITIRPYQLEDAEEINAAVAESRDTLAPWLPWSQGHQTVDETRDFIIRSTAQWLLRENLNATIWENTTGRFLGGIGVHPRDWEIRSFEIGYWLRDSAVGQGYMTEAVRMVADELFGALQANRVSIRCDARNDRSAAIPRRLGFVQEAHLRKDGRAPDDTLRDTLVFALTADDPRWP
jgi:RimJ/RimL family protein N-acetyltransferase